MRVSGIACAAVAVCATSGVSAQFSVFTDRSAWEAALGGAAVVTEDFNSTALQTINDGSTLDTGLVQITRDGSPNGGDGALAISPGSQFGNFDGTNHLDGETGASPHEIVKVEFNGMGVIGFGADWVSPFSGDGIGLEIDGELFLIDTIAGFDSGFFGIVADSGTFNSVNIVGNPATDTFQELWQADNFSYAVPAPASAALIGLAGLAARRRR